MPTARLGLLGLAVATISVSFLLLVATRFEREPSPAAATEPGRSVDTPAARGDAATGTPHRKAAEPTLAAVGAILRTTIGMRDAPQAYWRATPREAERHTEAAIAAEAQARARLVAEFGAAIRQQPALRALFFPLAERLPFLSSAQQIAVRDAERRLRHALMATDPEGRAAVYGQHLATLTATIGETLTFEYALRAAPLGDQLRASGLDLTETEFRATFRLLQSLGDAPPSPREYGDIRRALRDLLGTQRFAALWATRDSRFAALERVGRRFDLDPDTIMSAYALVNDTQDAMLSAALDTGDASGAGLRALYDSARHRLAELVGDAAARAIWTAISMPTERSPRSLGTSILPAGPDALTARAPGTARMPVAVGTTDRP